MYAGPRAGMPAGRVSIRLETALDLDRSRRSAPIERGRPRGFWRPHTAAPNVVHTIGIQDRIRLASLWRLHEQPSECRQRQANLRRRLWAAGNQEAPPLADRIRTSDPADVRRWPDRHQEGVE